ncbi:porin [Paraburkholderia nemoris]|uniref:porin n=1 Tax=Paraburkholderia nemoris TaxID=2793076 RepID=UPI0038BA64D2
MKKFAIPLTLVSALGLTQHVYAQSSVTLYGLIDAGFGYTTTNQGNRYSMMNGNLNGDRWGLKGREDLGGGLAAIFQLENGFDVGSGKFNQGGREFGRGAWVGLTSNSLGTVKFGRQYDPLVDQVQGLTSEAVLGSPFTTPGDVDNNDNSARVSNAIKYVSPTFGGFQFEGMYALDGIAGQPGQGSTYSAAASYTAGALSIAGGYLHAANASVTPGTLRTTWASTTDSLFDGVVSNGYQTASAFGIAHVAARYITHGFTLGAAYSYSQFKSDAQSIFTGEERYTSGKAYVLYQFNPALMGGIGYIYTHASGDTSASYNQVSIGGTYFLSKRTDFYTVAAYQRAAGTQRSTTGALGDAVASIGSYGVTGNGNSQTMVIVGMRHRF